jgi:hypothetical protein
MKRPIAVVAAVLFVILFTSCNRIEIQSGPRDREINVDGDSSDWKGTLHEAKDAGFSWGLINDGEYLYIAVATFDRAVERQIMLSGIYLWFDETGKESKNFGIYYPIGLRESGETPPPPQRGRPDSLMIAFFDSAHEVMLYSPSADDWQKTRADTLAGVKVAAGFKNHSLVLEYRVPLARHDAGGYGVGAAAGAVIGVGLESPEIEMPEMNRGGPPGEESGRGPEGGSGGRPDGQPGMGGPPGTGGPGARGPGGESPLKPIELWAKVALSKG